MTVREAGYLYVDKSAFVAEVLTAPAQIMLYPRPRRFGKTLSLSMLHAFFEIGGDRTALFEDLEVWRDPAARAHFQRHPVIKLTFKDVKHRTWSDALAAIGRVLSSEAARHAPPCRIRASRPGYAPAWRPPLQAPASSPASSST